MTGIDPYVVLGISRDVTREEFQKVRKLRLREAHPDRHGVTASSHEHFCRVQAAIEAVERTLRKHGEREEVPPFEFDLGPLHVRGIDHGRGMYSFVAVGARGGLYAFHPVGKKRRFVYEREIICADFPRSNDKRRRFVVIHGHPYPICGGKQRLLAMDLLPLDPASDTPYCIIVPRRSWLLVRQSNGHLVARNGRGILVRLGGYGAFVEKDSVVAPIGERIFPPFEVPLFAITRSARS